MFRRLLRPGVSDASLFVAGFLATGVTAYLTQVLLARDAFLGPTGFGALAALVSVLSVDAVLASAITATTAHGVADALARGKATETGPLLRLLATRVALRAGLGLSALLVLASPFLTRFFHLTSLRPALVLAVLPPVNFLFAVASGGLQGWLVFRALTLATLTGAVFHLLFAVVLVSAGLGVSGALLAHLLSVTLALGVAFIPIRARTPPAETAGSGKPADLSLRSVFGYAGPVALAVLGLTALFSVNVILARHFLSPEAAGLFSGLTTVGRAVYLIGLPLVLLMFPRVTRRVAQGRPVWRVLALSGGSIAAVGLFFTAVSAVVPETVLRLTVGASYLPGSRILWLFAGFFTLVSLATWLTYALLAFRRTGGAILPLLLALAQAGVLLRLHGSVREIILVSIVSAGLLLSGLGALTVWVGLRTRHQGRATMSASSQKHQEGAWNPCVQ